MEPSWLCRSVNPASESLDFQSIIGYKARPCLKKRLKQGLDGSVRKSAFIVIRKISVCFLELTVKKKLGMVVFLPSSIREAGTGHF